MLGALLLGVPEVVCAQTGSVESDSLRSYELSEIVVGGESAERPPLTPGTIRRVGLAALVRADSPDVAGLARLIPSAHVQTNSRGESLIYLRSTGERQVAVFLDGALLNVPWDNRVDLAALPAALLGGLKVTHGAATSLFGTNVLGGVVELSSRDLQGPGSQTEITAVRGENDFSRIEVAHLRRTSRGSLLATAGFNRTDGISLGQNVKLPYGQMGDSRRSNTDRRIAHLFIRGTRRFGDHTFGVSLLHSDTQKGVAPEGHLDPDVESVRYWRYPSIHMTMLSTQVLTEVSGWRLRGAAWTSLFGQEIDQFASFSFDSLAATQEDRDRTGGLRLVAHREVGPGELRAGWNGLFSTHLQTDFEASAGGLVPSPEQRYRQDLWSGGLEYVLPVGTSATLLFGGNVDRVGFPDTFDKPSRDPSWAWGGTVSLEALAGGLSWHSTLGRKVRFPTMRELFGTALNRFLINDDLRPESGVLADLGVSGSLGDTGEWEVTGFANRTYDTIGQTNVVVDGRRLRQRINLEGSSVWGLEVVAGHRPLPGIRVDFNTTLMRARAFGEPDRGRLVEKPAVLARISSTATPSSRAALTLEAEYTGRAYGLAEDNTLEALPRIIQVHGRAALRHYTAQGLFGELFVRVDNLTDQSVFPQLGLPGPGRTVQVGISLAD